MRHILQGTHAQIQANTKEIDRMDQLVESLRNQHFAKSDADSDLAKKLVNLERDTTLHSKQISQDLFELKQTMRDFELSQKNVKHQLDQMHQMHELRSRDGASTFGDTLHALQLQSDQQDRTLRKLAKELEVSTLIYNYAGQHPADARHRKTRHPATFQQTGLP
jgi:chromosome segregation ATPase